MEVAVPAPAPRAPPHTASASSASSPPRKALRRDRAGRQGRLGRRTLNQHAFDLLSDDFSDDEAEVEAVAVSANGANGAS